MISAQKLEELRNAYLILAQMMDFPEEELLTSDFLAEVKGLFPETEEKAEVIAILEALQGKNLMVLKEEYTGIFELNKRITLYTTYYRFDDSRERGGVLAKLKMLYEMFGVSLDAAELTDYLPSMLEFLGMGEWAGDERLEDLQLLFDVLEDGTYEILQAAKEIQDEPYIRLISVIRNTLRYALINERKEVNG
ncbi:nitrate reductase molybdenum cofactor assembly chaperone [Lactococcus termiticola]|uniref:nitrate reductase molybdenum cofactor assembly chaperone n=1 Tax=Lactococcus termiticola TaxID=2169526 RepID=UPI000D642606|nr:nitrate reductase molybdenum cofactor assembly chaperone [Lactococcus termiticola]